MNRSSLISIALVTSILAACDGSSSSSTPAGGSAGLTPNGGVNGDSTIGGNVGSGNSDGGVSAMLSDIAGVWDMSSLGDQARAEYWDIKADGTFETYTYRDTKDVYIAAEGRSLSVTRCFENQTNMITAAGDNVYNVEGLFTDERYGAGTINFNVNPDGTLQAKYATDVVVCGLDGCSSGSLDLPYPRVANDFNTNNLFLCPKSVVQVSSLVTTDAEISSSAGSYWDCTFVNQDDRTAESSTAQIRVGSDGQGVVTVNNNDRPFEWFTRTDNDLSANYSDGSGSFILNDLILYTVSETNDRLTALDTSSRTPVDGPVTTTYFETDCSLVQP